MRKSIRYIVVLAASFLPLLAHACGPGEYYYPRQVHYSFLSSDIYNDGERPFNVRYEEDLYPGDGKKPEWMFYKDNIIDWANYFENCVSREEVYELFYVPYGGQWDTITAYISGASNVIQPEFKNNGLLQLLRKQKGGEVLTYFIFAKQCEAVSGSANYWDNPNKPNDYWGGMSPEDSLAYIQLLAEGEKLYTGSKDKDLKIRYAYQLVRLAHYSGKFKQAENFYKDLIAKSGTRMSLKFYALEQAAGAVYKQGRRYESNRMFIQVYDNCTSRRWNSYEGLSIHSQNDWQQTYALCNPRERAVLYTLLPFQADMPADKTSQLNAAYKQGPDAEYLRAMVAKELRRMEIALLPVKPLGAWDSYASMENKPSSGYISYLGNFIKARITDSKVSDKSFWNFAAGYMAFMHGRYAESNQYFGQVSNGKELLLQVRKMRMLSDIALAKTITPDFEQTIEAHVEWLLSQPNTRQNQDLIVYLFGQLDQKYKQQQQLAKAELCKGTHIGADYDLWYNPHTAPLDELLALMSAKNQSNWEKLLLKTYRYNYNDILEMRATRMLSNYQFAEAAKEYEKLPANYIITNGHNKMAPALVKYGDRWNSEYNYSYGTWEETDSCLLYNRKQVAYRMLALQKRLQTEPQDSAHLNYTIGQELFGLTHWGPNWRLVDYYRGSWTESVRTRYSRDDWEKEVYFNADDICKAEFVGYYDCHPAMNYFLKAAMQSKNKEEAAQCVYMAALCEWRNRSVLGKYNNDNIIPYGPLFARLRDEYRDTEFKRQLIAECSVFGYYCEAKKR